MCCRQNEVLKRQLLWIGLHKEPSPVYIIEHTHKSQRDTEWPKIVSEWVSSCLMAHQAIQCLTRSTVDIWRNTRSTARNQTNITKTYNNYNETNYAHVHKNTDKQNIHTHSSVQFSSISSIVLRGKVSERPAWKDESWALLETDCDWWTGSEGEAAVGSRQLELRWKSSALFWFRDRKTHRLTHAPEYLISRVPVQGVQLTTKWSLPTKTQMLYCITFLNFNVSFWILILTR